MVIFLMQQNMKLINTFAYYVSVCVFMCVFGGGWGCMCVHVSVCVCLCLNMRGFFCAGASHWDAKGTCVIAW